MKNSVTIVFALVTLSMISCLATSDNYRYQNSGSNRNNDQYYQGFSDGYRAGYYQSPDGYWYAPNVIYLDNNGSYYRNGRTYNSRNSRDNVIISPKRNSMHNQTVRPQSGVRTDPNTNYRSQSNGRVQQNTIRQPARDNQNNVRVQPQRSQPQRSQPQVQQQQQQQPAQQQQETRSSSNESLRKQ